ncbi:MAG TPA: ribonuclease R [Alphaproteobacteria bacterium]|nr:ribonuclease R [Alphaproteobacteria bacterium]
MGFKKNFEQSVLKYFQDNKDREVSFRTLCKVFNVKGQGRNKIKDAVLNLEEKGLLRYKPRNLYVYSDVKVEKPVEKSRNNNNSEVKTFDDMIAVYHQATDTYQPLQNDLSKLTLNALEADAEDNKLENGNIVLIKPMKHKDSKTVKAAKFVKVIAKSIIGNESLLSIIKAEIPHEFPQDVLDEVEKIESGMTDSEIAKREDLRKLPFVTIDGEDAKDFDDAVFAEPWIDQKGKHKGGCHIIVAIADVAFYIKKGSALETEAFTRGNSTYFPDMVVPMLPEKLCNDLCSLRPNEDRPVMAAHLYIDDAGSLKKYKFSRAVIHSHKRLTYNDVQKAINGKFNDVIDKDFYEQAIIPLEDAFEALQDKRTRRGALELETTETQIIFNDETGNIDDIIPRSRFKAHMLIEELMILANIAAAKALENYACMYRVHDEPSNEKVSNLQKNLDGLRFKFKMNPKTRSPHEFKKLIDKIGSRQDRETLMGLILRSQSQAKYSSDNVGHFGLALSHYAHFTSPIRRYSDLIVHRLLVASLDLASEGGVKYSRKQVEEISEHISKTERVSQKAEWDSKERFIARFYSKQINKNFNATVVSVNSFGMFIRIPETGAEGLLPFRSMKNDFYIFDERTNTLRGKRTRKVITVGTKLKVKLAQANIIFGKLSFDFVSFN